MSGGAAVLGHDNGPGPGIAPSVAPEIPGSSGQPLDPATRALMEPRFGHDFGRVRVHANGRAAESAAAVDAVAYTVGHDIVFGTGQYAPGSAHGRSLLAHELAHVVQQPPGRLSRKPDTDIDKKQRARAHHEQQQRLVLGFLKDALKLKPNPKDPLDADTLYRNTAELIETPKPGRKISLTILTPTHYSTDARPVYFDSRCQHPRIGGNYPADPDPNNPKPSGQGLVSENPETAGRVHFAPQPQALSTMKKEEVTLERVSPTQGPSRSPSPAPAPPRVPASAPVPWTWSWTQGSMLLFFNDLVTDITDAGLRNVFVHEGQHVVDLSQRTLEDPGATDSQMVLEHYKSEFRSFWIQPAVPPRPPEPGVERIYGPAIENPPAPDKPANSQKTVTDTCPCRPAQSPTGGAATTPSPPKSVQTGLKNRRQEVIFLHLIYKYPNFKCFYVCDAAFRKEVDDFAFPAGVNVVNSQRLLELNLELQKLDTKMKPADVAKTGFRQAVLDLDAVDWAFLKETKLSAPFWKDLDDRAPKPLVEAVKKSAKAGKVDQAALDKATVP